MMKIPTMKYESWCSVGMWSGLEGHCWSIRGNFDSFDPIGRLRAWSRRSSAMVLQVYRQHLTGMSLIRAPAPHCLGRHAGSARE